MDDYLVRAASASPVISLSNPNTISSSDDGDTTPNNPTPINQATPICSGAIVVSGNGGGSTSARKPRGRPPGSKNKPKPPVVITRDSESAMKPVILELASGCDIIAALSAFSLRRRAVVSVLSASGAVSNVTIRHPNSPSSNMMSFIIPGRFDLLSLSGNILPPSSSSSSNSTTSTNAGFSILMAGPQGQVIGGTLAGSLTAADTVMVVAAVYSSPEIHHLPYPVDTEEADVGAAAGEAGGKKVKSEVGQHEAPLYGGPVGMVVRPEMALWSSQPPPPPPASAPQY